MRYLLLLLLASCGAATNEPDYCARMTHHEIQATEPTPEKLHAYKLGRTVLAGMAIGYSDAESVKETALRYSSATEGHCTWYLNRGNAEAETLFSHQYLTNPRKLSEADAVDEYTAKVKPLFKEGFVACAASEGYLAVGCNAMKHRGPTVFGMILAYSGCSPETSAELVNETWGLNGVDPDVRLALIREAYEWGEQDPETSRKLRDAFSAR